MSRHKSLLRELRSAGRAVLAVSVYDLEGLAAVGEAAVELQSPIIAQVGSSAFGHVSRPVFMAAAVEHARLNSLVYTHLDHSRDMRELEACLAAGYDSVMYDGSHLALEENIEQTTHAAELAHSVGVWIEGELGAVPGHEDESTGTSAGALTDVDQARWFVEATGVNALAVSVGNVHGIPWSPVRLNLDHLARLAEAVPVPLVLHGASGLSTTDRRRAIEIGVAKININTEARRAYLRGLKRSLAESDTDSVVRHLQAGRAEMRAALVALGREVG